LQRFACHLLRKYCFQLPTESRFLTAGHWTEKNPLALEVYAKEAFEVALRRSEVELCFRMYQARPDVLGKLSSYSNPLVKGKNNGQSRK
jgi:hypothetical protein